MNAKRFWILIALLVVASMVAAGCAAPATQAPPPATEAPAEETEAPAPAAEEPFKIAFVYVAPIGDPTIRAA
jgi:simple sugar transport system substrate-binding protein